MKVDIYKYYEETAERLAAKNRTILTDVESIKSINQKVCVTCDVCGNTGERILKNLRNNTRGCTSCQRSDPVEQVQSLLEARGFYDITKAKSRVSYKCSICSKDEYTVNGLCSGIFESDWSNLKDGGTSCRCSPKPTLTKEQQEYRINKALSEKAKFVRWDEEYEGIHSKFWAKCSHHSEWKATVADVVNSKSGCPLCAKTGYAEGSPGTLYILKSKSCCKLGITNLSAQDRVSYVSRKSKEKFEVVKQWTWEDGSVALSIEKRLLPQLREFYDNPPEKHHGYTECFVDLNEDVLINLVKGEMLERKLDVC